MIRTLTIPGEPVAKARPRVVNGHSFTPAKTKNYETLVKELYWAAHSQEKPLEGPLQMSMIAYFRIPKNISQKRRRDMLDGRERPTKRPDIDNVIKAVADALNGLAYTDDSQIAITLAAKLYADIPRVEVQFYELREMLDREPVWPMPAVEEVGV